MTAADLKNVAYYLNTKGETELEREVTYALAKLHQADALADAIQKEAEKRAVGHGYLVDDWVSFLTPSVYGALYAYRGGRDRHGSPMELGEDVVDWDFAEAAPPPVRSGRVKVRLRNESPRFDPAKDDDDAADVGVGGA